MKKIWQHQSILTRYYLKSMSCFFLFWGLFVFFKTEFIDTLFFAMAFVWHFALMTPGLKEQMLTGRQKFSFLSIVVRINYYLQLFIKINKISFGSSIIRALSPFAFTFALMVVGGNGNIIFTLLGSVAFELTYYLMNKKKEVAEVISAQPSDRETPPTIPNAENFHE